MVNIYLIIVSYMNDSLISSLSAPPLLLFILSNRYTRNINYNIAHNLPAAFFHINYLWLLQNSFPEWKKKIVPSIFHSWIEWCVSLSRLPRDKLLWLEKAIGRVKEMLTSQFFPSFISRHWPQREENGVKKATRTYYYCRL